MSEDQKFDDLSERIAKAQHERDIKEGKVKKRAAYNNAQAGMEFALSILVGGYLGYLLDQKLDTAPLFLILLFLLGVGAGFASLYRASKNMGGAIGYSELHNKEKQAKTLRKEKDNISPE